MAIRKTIRRILAAAGAAAVLVSAVSVQAAALADQVTPGGVRFKELQGIIEKRAADGEFASFGCAVFCGDEIVYTNHFGEIDREAHIPADENTVYEWGSISKTMIWVSAMQLYEQGKLDLNADIRGYLPENFFQHLSYDDPITFLNLMNHNAGFCETTYQIQTFDENAILSLKDALQASEPAQAWKPGTVTCYSNWAAGLAGYVVECISGMPFSEYLHKNILEPLGMEHTAVTPDHKDNPWVREQREKLMAYSFTPAGAQSCGQEMAFIMLYPAGAVTGTIADLATYAQALVNKEAPLFDDPATQELMFSGSSYYGSSEYPECCHGFWPEYDGVPVVGHDGGTNACISSMLFDRESGVGYVMMSNGAGNLKGIDEELFGKLEVSTFEAGGEKDYSDYTGNYNISRSNRRGLLSLTSRLNYIPLKNTGESKYKMGSADFVTEGGGLLMRVGEENTFFYGTSRLSDGTALLETGSADAICNPLFWVEFGSIVLYVLMAIVSVILLLVKLIQRIAKKRKHYAGMGMITLGQLAKIGSAAALIAAISIYAQNMGLTKQVGMIVGIAQAVCAVIFALAALSAIGSMFSKKEKAKAPKYLFSFLCNAFAAAFVVYFQMYQFWGC